MTTPFIIGYLFIALLFFVGLYRWLYLEHVRKFKILGWRSQDRWFATTWGGCVALCWPLSGAIFLAVGLAKVASIVLDKPLQLLESIILKGLR